MTKNALQKRLKAALDNDNTILIDRKDLAKAKGFSEEYLAYLGLKKADLKKLETMGGAIRGLAKYSDGTTKTAWILLGDTPTPADTLSGGVDVVKFMEENKELMQDLTELEKQDV